MNNKIKDFGKKIGGAKKDLWKWRNLQLSDISNLSDREAFKYAIKNNIWKKPDYKELCKTLTVVVVYFIKKVRDSLPAKVMPTSDTSKNKLNIKSYIELVENVRDAVMKMKSENDLKKLFNNIFIKNGYYDDLKLKNWKEKALSCVMLKNKLLKVTQINNFSIWYAKKEIKRSGFPDKKSFSFDNSLTVKTSDTGGFNVEKSEKYVCRILNSKPFKTKEEAEKFLKALKRSSNKKAVKFSRPELKHIIRTGTDYRNNMPISTDMILDTFKFRGGEFGNWCNDTERQLYIDYAYDAFIDLAAAVGINPIDISLHNELGIAFGARGSGNAMAHYEPARVVINLTKTKGAGCFAHEWGHALDDFIGRLSGNKNNSSSGTHASEGLSARNSALSERTINCFNEIIKIMTKRKATLEEKKESIQGCINKAVKYAQSWIKPIVNIFQKEQKIYGSDKVHRAATKEEQNKMNEIINNMLTGKTKDASEFNDLFKEVKGKRADKKYIDNINIDLRWLNNYKDDLMKNIDEFKMPVDSDYMKNSKKADLTRKKPYYADVKEMFARAFEAYVQDIIYAQGNRSDYLVHNADNKAYFFKIYPEGEEREKLNKAFDKLFKTLKEEKIFSEFSYSKPEVKAISSSSFNFNNDLHFVENMKQEKVSQISFFQNK